MKFIQHLRNDNLKRLFLKAMGKDVHTGLRLGNGFPKSGKEKSLVAYPHEVVVSYYDDIIEEIWLLDGEVHRSYAPAILERDRHTGRRITERYYEQGKLHRTDGPALREMYDEEDPVTEKYYVNGELHRKDGPAVIEFDHTKEKTVEKYYVRGVEVDPETLLLPTLEH